MNKSNDAKEAINNLVNGFGVMAETAAMANKAFIAAGFSKEDSRYYTGKVLDNMLNMATGGNKSEK